MLQYEKEDVEQIMEWTNLSYAQAEKYLLDVYKDVQSENVFDLLDCIELEVKSKQNPKRNYVKSAENSAKKARKPKTVKISQNKQELFYKLALFLQNEYENVEILTENKLFQVKIGSDVFKIDVIQQRNKKL